MDSRRTTNLCQKRQGINENQTVLNSQRTQMMFPSNQDHFLIQILFGVGLKKELNQIKALPTKNFGDKYDDLKSLLGPWVMTSNMLEFHLIRLIYFYNFCLFYRFCSACWSSNYSILKNRTLKSLRPELILIFAKGSLL